ARMPAAQWARTLPIGKHGITAPTLWARLGDAPGRWVSFRHLQAQAGAVPVTKRSGKQQRLVQFRFACDKALRYVVDQVAFLSLRSSEWARPYYDQQRARGHSHREALRALGAKWVKIIFILWERQVPYDELYHLANDGAAAAAAAPENNRLTWTRESLPCCRRHCRTAGPLRSAGVTPPPRYLGPVRHPLAVGRFPGEIGYTAYPVPPISRRDEEGFSSCL